jgi:hypothetical protein
MTILFGVLALVIGWFSVVTDLPLMFHLREIAIVLLVLFFYSLTMDKIDEMEQKIRIVSSGKKKRDNLVP